MKPAVALSRLIRAIASAVGPEGAFLLAGTALLAVGASYITPAGPWLVTGGVAILAGLALAIPAPKGRG